MYYIYHIPGKKVGVTRNLNDRVTKQQGYKPGEYQILWEGVSIDLASELEIQYQKAFGYATDLHSYKNLIKRNKMKLNATEQTTTFPVPISKLKGQLMDTIGLKWETPQGYKFEITKENINWILENARPSMFSPLRCYIYNKAFYEAYNTDDALNSETDHFETIFDLIREWAEERGIYKSGDSKTQYVKLMEEAGELAQSLLKNDKPEVKDAIGDMVVVLTNLAHLEGMSIEECVGSAYNEIANRKGEMKNGTFVKQTL